MTMGWTRWAVIGIAAMAVSGAGSALGDPLATYRWSERPFLVFAPAADDAALAAQLAHLSDRADGLAERDMAVLVIGPSDVRTVFGRAPAGDADAAALRRQVGAEGDTFRAVLVGKDGGVKLSEPEPVAADTLFALIDGMPMRRRELREGGG